jgi:DNA invertase Pin-like site-specific DNA recombinase
MVNVAIFVRVSRQDQQYDRQVSELTEFAAAMKYQVVSVISEKISGAKKNKDRPGVTELLKLARSRAIEKVLVSEVSRLGRDARETNELLCELTDLKVSIFTKNFGLETLVNGKKNPIAALIFGIIKELAEYERELLRERIISGQDEARRKGKKIGRAEGSIKIDAELLKEYPTVVKKLRDNYSIRETAKLCDVSPGTVQKVSKALKATL